MKARKLFLYSLVVLSIGLFGMAKRIVHLQCKIKAEPKQSGCRLILNVSNHGKKERVLEFSNARQYDFIVRDAQGKEVWQWSWNRAFSQSVQKIFIRQRKEITFTGLWHYTDKNGNLVQPGAYMVQGLLTIIPKPIETESIKINIPASYISAVRPIKGRITKILDKLYLLERNGYAYYIESPFSELYRLQGRNIEVTSYSVKSIPGTVDKKIRIKNYKKLR